MATSTPPRHDLPASPDPLPVPVVDNHVHLDSTREGEAPLGVAEALARARAVGVERVVHVACDVEAIERALPLARAHPQVVLGVALHPNDAARHAARGDLEAAYALVERVAADPLVRVVGETGLDYFRTGPDGVGAQQDALRWHIDLAKRTGKALQIHDRDAHDDVLRVLDEEGAPETVVLHCFSGGPQMARECVERGYLLSFAGTVTFKNARQLREALAVTPLANVLVETDAPYLTPTPHRGAPNASYLLPLTVRTMAATLMVDVPTLCSAVTANAERAYGTW